MERSTGTGKEKTFKELIISERVKNYLKALGLYNQKLVEQSYKTWKESKNELS